MSSPIFDSMKTLTINWHYPRSKLAQEVLGNFELGTLSRGTIFAPRRKGKTEFILRDLLSLARKRARAAVYANLWDDKDNPHRALAIALKEAVVANPKGSGLGVRSFHSVVNSPVLWKCPELIGCTQIQSSWVGDKCVHRVKTTENPHPKTGVGRAIAKQSQDRMHGLMREGNRKREKSVLDLSFI